MKTIMPHPHFTEILFNNAIYLVETATIWCLVGFAHIVGLSIDRPVVIDLLPYIQIVSLFLACIASTLTIYKIYKDLKK